MAPIVNGVASAVRSRGGVVAWVLSRMTAMPKHFAAILGTDLATKYFNDGQANGPGTRLWHELDRNERTCWRSSQAQARSSQASAI